MKSLLVLVALVLILVRVECDNSKFQKLDLKCIKLERDSSARKADNAWVVQNKCKTKAWVQLFFYYCNAPKGNHETTTGKLEALGTTFVRVSSDQLLDDTKEVCAKVYAAYVRK
jgi:hypothetical protein